MEPNIDDKLVTWDRILKELVVDVDELNKDLQESIRYIGAAGVLVIAFAEIVRHRHSVAVDDSPLGVDVAGVPFDLSGVILFPCRPCLDDFAV